MTKNITFAALLSLSLTGACAADLGSSQQGLDSSETVDGVSEVCGRTIGDFGQGELPPGISIPVGDREIPFDEAIEAHLADPTDAFAAIVAEYATATLNVDSGSTLDDYRIDLLVTAEAVIETGPDIGFPVLTAEYADKAQFPTIFRKRAGSGNFTLPELQAELLGLNKAFSYEMPCSTFDETQALEQDTSIPPFTPPGSQRPGLGQYDNGNSFDTSVVTTSGVPKPSETFVSNSFER